MPLPKRKKILFGILAIFLFLFVAEMAARFIVTRNNRLGIQEKQKTFAAYQNKVWVDQYFKDDEECSKQRSEGRRTAGTYVRYLLFDLGSECKTETINYVGGRIRKTWNPEMDASSSIYKIGMFGGSTMLGLGVTDDLTIPSQLSRLLNVSTTSSTRYFVTNYAMSSYTYTQSLMKLIMLLREGEYFDYVIFYGGTNDIDNAYDAGEVGALLAEQTIKNKLEGGLSGQIKEFIKEQLNSCGLCKGLAILSRNTPFLKNNLTPIIVRLREFIQFKEGVKGDEEDLARFAEDIVNYYAESHTLLDALAKAYGFKYAEFLQPTLLYDDDPNYGEEMILNIDPRLTDKKLMKLYDLAYDALIAKHLSNFFNTSDVLKSREHAYYLDAVHINDDGNRDVAQRMFDVVKLGL